MSRKLSQTKFNYDNLLRVCQMVTVYVSRHIDTVWYVAMVTYTNQLKYVNNQLTDATEVCLRYSTSSMT